MRALGHSSWRTGAGARGPWLAVWVGALLVLGAVLSGGGTEPVAEVARPGSGARAEAAKQVAVGARAEAATRTPEALPDVSRSQAGSVWPAPCDDGGTGAHGLRGAAHTSSRPPTCLRFHGAGYDTWAAFDGGPSFCPAQPGWSAPRGRCALGGFALPRWSRSPRQTSSDTAMARRVRYPVAPVSARSGLADQPPLVTRPLRGPPASA